MGKDCSAPLRGRTVTRKKTILCASNHSFEPGGFVCFLFRSLSFWFFELLTQLPENSFVHTIDGQMLKQQLIKINIAHAGHSTGRELGQVGHNRTSSHRTYRAPPEPAHCASSTVLLLRFSFRSWRSFPQQSRSRRPSASTPQMR